MDPERLANMEIAKSVFHGIGNPTTKASELTVVTKRWLSLDANGNLTVDFLILRTAPKPNEPKDTPPAVLRSVYKRPQ
jgi:hypothetical protein